MRMRTLAVLAALALVAGGCADSDAEQAKKALAASIMQESEQFKVSQSEADCVAAGFVDGIGVDQLKEYGFLTEGEDTPKNLGDVPMSEGDADAAANAFVDCVDVQQLLTDELPLEGMDPDVADCVKDALSEDVIRDLLAATFRGDSPDSAAPEVGEQLSACIGS